MPGTIYHLVNWPYTYFLTTNSQSVSKIITEANVGQERGVKEFRFTVELKVSSIYEILKDNARFY